MAAPALETSWFMQNLEKVAMNLTDYVYKNPRLKHMARVFLTLSTTMNHADYEKYMARDQAAEKFKEQFDEADLDGDGLIDRAELVKLIEAKYNNELNAEKKQLYVE